MNLALFLPNWIGDLAMATPALRALRKFVGREGQLVGIVRPYAAPVLAGTTFCNELILDRSRSTWAGRWKLVRELRSRRFDGAIVFPNSFSAAMLAWLSGAPRRIGYASNFRRGLLTESLTRPRALGQWTPISAVDYYLQLAAALGCPPESKQVELATMPADEDLADDVWRKLGLDRAGRVVALNLGGTYGVKHWPTDSYVKLAERLVQECDAHVLVLCGPNEVAAASELERRANHPQVVSLAGETPSIALTKACLKRCVLLVSNDSGPRHLAAAFQIPTLALFGPTDPRWSVNYNPHEIHLRRDLPCSPCNKKVCPLGHQACLKELTVDDVFVRAARMLSLAVRKAA